MKISLFNNYGAKNSAPVFDAIALGLKRINHNVVFNDINADVAVIWSMLWTGRMSKNKQVYETYNKEGKMVLVAEVGMIQRGHTWKLGIGGTLFSNYPTHIDDPARASKLNISLRDWQDKGSNIVIACQRTDSQQWSGQPSLNHWLHETVKKIKQFTDRPVIIRPHPRGQAPTISGCIVQRPQQIYNTYDDFDYYKSLEQAWAVVNHNSGPGPQSVIAGVPAFVDASSLASPVGNLDFSTIENPSRPDRNSWLNWLSHSEWTLDEIKTGEPLLRLLNKI